MIDSFEKKGGIMQKRVDAIRTWLREEGAENRDKASKKNVDKDEAESLGRELIESVMENDANIDDIRELISRGADVNMKDQQGWTALMWASGKGDKEVVEVLISNGADVNLKGKTDMTALMYAALYGQKEIIAMLINSGAKVDLQDNKGKTVLYYTGTEEIKTLLEDAAGGQK